MNAFSNALTGKTIAITRSRKQASKLRKKLEANGARVLELPLIETKAVYDPLKAGDIFKEIGHFSWILFTSANGVEHFFNQFMSAFGDIRALGMLRIAVIGDATAEALSKFYLKPDLIPNESTAEGLSDAIAEFENIESERILIVTGNLNRDTLKKKLEEEHAIVDTLQVYQTIKTDLNKIEDAETFRLEGADAIVFASSSAVISFRDQIMSLKMEKKAKIPKTCSIGPQTSSTLRKLNMPVDIAAVKPSLDGIVDALIEYFE